MIFLAPGDRLAVYYMKQWFSQLIFPRRRESITQRVLSDTSMKHFNRSTIVLMLLALLMAPACDTLEEIELSEEAQPTFVTPVYHDNGNGTITDTTSNGVMWEKCPYDFSGDSCVSGVLTSQNYTTAKTTCEEKMTAGFTDWRLPTKAELLTFATTYPDYKDFFPLYETSVYWWSSTPLNENFYYRVTYYPLVEEDDSPITSLNYIHCARSIQP